MMQFYVIFFYKPNRSETISQRKKCKFFKRCRKVMAKNFFGKLFTSLSNHLQKKTYQNCFTDNRILGKTSLVKIIMQKKSYGKQLTYDFFYGEVFSRHPIKVAERKGVVDTSTSYKFGHIRLPY